MKIFLFIISGVISVAAFAKQPNVILIVADDISAREFPFYGSPKWSDGRQAKTPMMDRLAEEGCFIETMWAATICKPSRVCMMNGTYSYKNKYWDNRHIGTDCWNTYSAYESGPITLGNMSRDAGYANIWISKNHISAGGDFLSMGFNEAVFNPAEPARHNGWNPFGTPIANPYPLFRTPNPDDWDHESFFFWPEMQLINHPDHPNEPWQWQQTHMTDFAPDLEMEHAFAFMERSKSSGNPFFILHTPHLGHLAKDPMDPDFTTVWPGTPELEWKDEGYIRKQPVIERLDDGSYKKENITPNGLSYHIEYLDYHVWQYVEKLKEMGELENTIILFSADNGTQDNAGRFGKGHVISQQGQHVPMLIYAPGVEGFVKGRQSVCSDFTDILPTLAEIMDFEFPEGYDRLDGKSLWPYLTGESNRHRDYIYSMRIEAQMIRNNKVMRDGHGHWYDVSKGSEDYDSYPKIDALPNGEYKDGLLAEKAKLEKELLQYDLYDIDSEAPSPPADADGDGIADWFEEQFGALDPKADPDSDGVNNFYEYLHGGDPTDPKKPTAQQLPHEVALSDAQGDYIGLEFERLEELGPDYWFLIEGTRDGEAWATDGVVQQHTRISNGDGTERIVARIAADKNKTTIQELRLTVKKPKKRQPRKYSHLLKK